MNLCYAAEDAMNRSHPRAWLDLDHARAAGYKSYYQGLTPADGPYGSLDGLMWDWWLAGWRRARFDDQGPSLAQISYSAVDRRCAPTCVSRAVGQRCPGHCGRPSSRSIDREASA